MNRDVNVKSECNAFFYTKKTGQYAILDCQLALELSSMVLLLEGRSKQVTADAKTIRIAALKALGATQTSINGRNYYLTQVSYLLNCR